MFCPRCGRQATDTQRFCKSCGTNLHSISQALTGAVVSPAQLADQEERLRDFRKGVKTVFTGLGLAAFFAFVAHSRAPMGIGLLVLFIGLGQIVRAMIFARPRLEFYHQAPGSQSAPGNTAVVEQAVPAPPAVARMPGSVTEDPTVRLGSNDAFSRPDAK